MLLMKGSCATLQMSTSSRQSSPEENESYSLSSSQTFSVYASSEPEFDSSEKFQLLPAKKPSVVDLTQSTILGMPEIPGLGSSFSSVDSIFSVRSEYVENTTDVPDNFSRLLEQIEESCKELNTEFVRLRYLDRRLKSTYLNSGDETRAAVLLSLLKDGISHVRVEFERLENLMLQEDDLESELIESCLSL